LISLGACVDAFEAEAKKRVVNNARYDRVPRVESATAEREMNNTSQQTPPASGTVSIPLAEVVQDATNSKKD
jgi:hypothetical protein